MASFRSPGQFQDDNEIERRIQDEIRRRAALQQSGVIPSGPGQAADSYSQHHMSMLQQQQRVQQPPGSFPGYPGGGGAMPHGHSPYTRVTNPYGGIAAAAAAYQQQQQGSGPLAQIYAVHQAERQRQQAQAANNAYGGPYQVATPTSSAGHAIIDHHAYAAAAAYGLGPPPLPPVNPQTPYNQRETTYGSATGAVGATAGTSQSPRDLAMMQQQQMLHQQDSYGNNNLSASSNHSRNSISTNKNKQGNNVGGLSATTPTSSASTGKGSTPTSYSSSTVSHDNNTPDSMSNANDNVMISDNNQDAVDNISGTTPLITKLQITTTPAPKIKLHSGTSQKTPKSGGSGGKSKSGVGSTGKAVKISSEDCGANGSPLSATACSAGARIIIQDGSGKTVIEDSEGNKWYTGCVPLGLDDDKYWLSELQVYLRSTFAEAFAATEDDIAAPMHGRNKPIALGQVGIRCMHCKRDNPAERGQQATSYPSLISGIYNSVQQMLRLHLDCCLSMPPDVRSKIEALKSSCSSRGGRKQYWIDSAKRLGLVDTPHGIHFGRDPTGPLPPLAGPSVNSKEGRTKNKKTSSNKAAQPAIAPEMDVPMYCLPSSDNIISSEDCIQPQPCPESPQLVLLPPPPPVDARPLVFPEDKSLISDYLYLTLEQMAPCVLMEADRVGCYKTRKVGFPGLACKHCVGQAGCGRYFPASEASLSQTTTSQTIMNHVRNCRRCPIEIRENLEIMKRNRMGPDGKRADKPKHGGRKVFFHRLWCRIQDLPFEEGKAEAKEGKKRKSKKTSRKKKSRSSEDGSIRDSDNDDDQTPTQRSGDESSEVETESEEDSEESDDDDEQEEEEDSTSSTKGKQSRKTSIGSSNGIVQNQGKKPHISPWFTGCVRLTKTDDPHWLSEMECFARSDLVEVFSYKEDENNLEGYAGRREPGEGQVGIRCVFCKAVDPSDRSNGCVAFPDTLSSIHSKVADMIRLHFPTCPNMPDGAVQTFKSYRGFDAKVANDDSQQYWVDSARDVGLANLPPAGPQNPGAWGMTFRRDPLQPSPSDELDLEQSASNVNIPESAYIKNSLVRLEDRGLCTDQVMLLLRQVRPCRFQSSDRRAGPGSRGRDRAMGFPGLCCLHCAGKNTLGRYFPVSPKNLTDSTTNSLQAHVSSCSYCPESIKASLAYLGHRSILQKAELSGSWKKSFFKKVWDRLHSERGWTSVDDDSHPLQEDGENHELDYEGVEDHEENAVAENDDDEEMKADDADGDAGSESDREELGDQMHALIKAAAIWLTEQDSAESKAGSRVKKPMPLPLGRAASLPIAKRRRVHF